MGRTIGNKQTQVKGRKKTRLKFRVVFLALLVITLTLFSINRLGTPFKSPVPIQTKATMEQKKANKALAKKIAWAGYGWKDKEWACLDKIFIKEAKYDHLAKNKSGSSAFGVGQILKQTLCFKSFTLINIFNTDIKLRALQKGGTADTIGISV